MAKLNEKQTLLLIGGITLLLCGGAGGGVYWADGLIEIEKQESAAKEKKIREGRKKINKIPGVENKVIVLRENVANYVKILPDEDQLTKFTRAAQKFAVLSGISIDRFVPVRGGAKGGAFRRVSYQYYFQATLWQFMKFMNFFESYKRFVRVRDFNLASGGSNKNGEDSIHNIRMTVETYVYNPDTKGPVTHISNYDVKLVALRHEIAAAGSLEIKDPYEFRGREGRRDIFVDPRQSDAGETRTSIVDQKRIIGEFSKEVMNLKEKWDHAHAKETTVFDRLELIRAVKDGLGAFERKLQQINEAKLIKHGPMVARWYKEVQMPYKALSSLVVKDTGERNRWLPKAEFGALIKSMKTKLVEGDHESVISHHSQVQNKIDVPKTHSLYRLRLQIEGLVLQAKVALEFKAIPLEISGVLVQANRKSGVILNGEVFEEGDYLNDTLFVKTVRDDEVEFVYKGFTLIKTW